MNMENALWTIRTSSSCVMMGEDGTESDDENEEEAEDEVEGGGVK